MHLGGFLSTQEARVALMAIASCKSYVSFVLGNLRRASITLVNGCMLHVYHFILIGLLQYSETCIKRTPSLKRTVAEVPK